MVVLRTVLAKCVRVWRRDGAVGGVKRGSFRVAGGNSWVGGRSLGAGALCALGTVFSEVDELIQGIWK